MAKIRNVSGERRFVVELGRWVDDDELFAIPDERAQAYADQPYFRAEAEATIEASALEETETVTVAGSGTGGKTSFGEHAVAEGGTGGGSTKRTKKGGE